MTRRHRPPTYPRRGGCCRLDHRLERLERAHANHVARGLRLEHHLFLGERVDADASLRRRLALDGDTHQSWHLEEAHVALREMALDHLRHQVNALGHVERMRSWP